MANEARVTSQLHIAKGNLKYDSAQPATYMADVTVGKGPSPGALLIATAGTDIDLSELATPALCVITNLDTTNFLEYGIWDGATFHELGEVQPGEFYVLRLSRNLTGLRLKADTAACEAIVEAFDD